MTPSEIQKISQLFNYQPAGVANSTSAMVLPQTLPNNGGTYTASGDSKITPTPVFTGVAPVAQKTAPAVRQAAPVAKAPLRNFYKNPDGSYYYSDTNKKILTRDELANASKTGVEIAAPGAASGMKEQAGLNYNKYRDPKTGKVMTPEEYAIHLGNKVPKGNGEITNYAGDAVSNPNETSAQLQARATNLNNSRNDIATGTTDPYKVGNTSGIAYSPTELAAIEKAYAGIYDPALNDVFSRLKTTQEAEKAKTDLETAKETRVFATNEAIRQWRATTGTLPRSGSGGKKADEIFTDTQLNTAARNAGVSVDAIRAMDEDLVNFFVAPPMVRDELGNKIPMVDSFDEDFRAILAGEKTVEYVTAEIMDSPISPAIQHYFIEQIPAAPAQKDGWFDKIWNVGAGIYNSITGK